MKKRFILLSIALTTISLAWCKQNKKTTEETKTDTEVEITVKGDQKTPKNDEDKLAHLYATVSCMVMDPNFREWFRDGENWREDGENTDEQMTQLYKKYGYNSEEEIEEDLKKVANSPSFSKKLIENIQKQCGDLANEELLEEITNNLKEEYGQKEN